MSSGWRSTKIKKTRSMSAKPGHEKQVKWVKEGTVRIIGVFDYRPKLGVGHLNGWPAQIVDLELFEKLK